MPKYEVRNPLTGAHVGTVVAFDPLAALDVWAVGEGFDDYKDFRTTLSTDAPLLEVRGGTP